MIRSEKREQIISAALRLFALKGYETTSVSMIAGEAGISKGLLYSYFDSKESLLHELLNDYLIMLGSLLNPDDDDEITEEELDNFLDGLRRSLKENNEYWRLWAQFSIRPETIGYLLERFNKGGEVMVKHQVLLSKYFAERFDDPISEELFFASLIKGFTLQYAFVPDHYSEEIIDKFFIKLKEMYLVEKRTPGN